MRILITGKNGQVGSELCGLYAAQSGVTAVGRDACDLSDEHSIRACVRRVQPAVILNAGAYTAVDLAEKESDTCFAVNAMAPRVLAQEASRLGALLLHYSTDYVFDGQSKMPYVETDPVSPVSVYGASKVAGEAALAEAGDRYLILRTSWVYCGQGKNFLRTMVRLGADRAELKVVDDQAGAPTSAAAIAMATVHLVERYARTDASLPSGIYHMSAAGQTTWCGFAQAIFNSGILTAPPRVLPIRTAEYPTPAKRPANSVLSNDKFAATFGFRLDPWQQQLDQVIAGMQVAHSPGTKSTLGME